MESYGIRITSPSGDKEPIIRCGSLKDAWEKMRNMAFRAAELASEKHGCKVELLFNKAEGKAVLYDTYENKYRYYNVVKI